MELAIIQKQIYNIRNQHVMLDYDLSTLYGIETKRLKEAVKRNIERFPPDFMFQLTREEYNSLRSQFATLENYGRGRYSKFNPFAFTEPGVAMLASVLSSSKAVEVNIAIVRAFIALRHFVLNYKELEGQIKELYQLTEAHGQQFKDVYDVLNHLVKTKQEEKVWQDRERVGFK